jgi:hypothetical protein
MLQFVRCCSGNSTCTSRTPYSLNATPCRCHYCHFIQTAAPGVEHPPSPLCRQAGISSCSYDTPAAPNPHRPGTIHAVPQGQDLAAAAAAASAPHSIVTTCIQQQHPAPTAATPAIKPCWAYDCIKCYWRAAGDVAQRASTPLLVLQPRSPDGCCQCCCWVGTDIIKEVATVTPSGVCGAAGTASMTHHTATHSKGNKTDQQSTKHQSMLQHTISKVGILCLIPYPCQ